MRFTIITKAKNLLRDIEAFSKVWLEREKYPWMVRK